MPTGEVGVMTSRLTAKFLPQFSQATLKELLSTAGVRLGRQLRIGPNTYDVRVQAGRDVIKTAAAIARLKCCEYAVPEILELSSARQTPNDPRIDSQWQWQNIEAPAAWKLSTGNGVRIAIIDWGFDLKHPELKSAVEFSAFFKENGLHQRASYFGDSGLVPNHEHGTLCAGMAVARANNDRFGCGIAFDATLVPIACSPIMTQQTLARAIAFAINPSGEDDLLDVAKRADVLSISVAVSSQTLSPVVQDALDLAARKGRSDKGTPIFFAVENSDSSTANDPMARDHRVAAIGMTKSNDYRGRCAQGDDLFLMAPGHNIYSTLPNSRFGNATGSSFAAPCVAGIVALMLSANPGLSIKQIRDGLINSCDKVGGVTYRPSGHHPKYGFGRVNARKAVEFAFKN